MNTKTARTHYFRTRERWGHSQYLQPKGGQGGEYSGLVISTPVVREGDFIEWATQYGTARALVTATEFVRDPSDMVKVTSARLVQRLDKDGGVLWER